MLGKLEYLIINFIFLQATPPDVTTYLLEKGEKMSVVGLLCFLVYILHQQGQRAAEQIRLLHEARMADMEEEIKYLRGQIETLKNK